MNKIESSIAKRSVINEEYADGEPDDFYVFW